MRLDTSEFSIRLWKKDGTYFGQIHELSILAHDDDPGALVRKLEAERDALLQRHRDAGVDAGTEPAVSNGKSTLEKREISVFALKTVIGTFAASILIVVTVSHGANRLENVIENTLTGIERPFQVIDGIAKKLGDRPAELQQRTARSLETIVHTLQPLTAKLAPLFPTSCRNGEQNSPS